MVEGVDTIVLERLRLISDQLGKVEAGMADMGSKLDGLTAKMDRLTTDVIVLGKDIHGIDVRVGHLEAKIGA